ncbi:MAG: redoxin domain-containing protein [Candidatus Omnitrophota bacterium]
MRKITVLFSIIICSVSCGFCSAAEEIDPQAIVAQIQKSYEQLKDVKVFLTQESHSQDSQVNAQGVLYFKAPDKLKMDFEIISANGKYRAKNLLIYDNNVLWQEQTNLDTKKISVFKSQLETNSISIQNLLEQFSPKQQFDNFIQQYNVIDVKVLNDESASGYILNMEIKPDARDRMIQMLKAKGQQKAELMVLEKVVFYWDLNKEFAAKIETQSKNQEFRTLSEYSDPEVNSRIKDQVFVYSPPADAQVMDISDITAQEAGVREYEGAENKQVGQAFPEFIINDIFNDKFSYLNLKGKVLIVNFWEAECAPCLKELPLIESLYQDIYTDQNVQILTVTTNKDKALELVEENSYSFPVLIDAQAQLAQQLAIDSIPKTFVVDKQGLISAVYMGYHPDMREILTKEISRLNPEE